MSKKEVRKVEIWNYEVDVGSGGRGSILQQSNTLTRAAMSVDTGP